MRTLPLTVRTRTASPETSTLPETHFTSTSRARWISTRPLVFMTRHDPRHSSTSMRAECVRRSAEATDSTRIEPLAVVTRAAPR